ncbi:MAG: multicopper oxidase domain-containing protein [Thermoleophilia bacterium]
MGKVVSLLLGLAVGGLLIVVVFLANSANDAKRDANAAAAAVTPAVTGADPAATPAVERGPDAAPADDASSTGHDSHSSSFGTLESFAGLRPDDADERAKAHEAFPAELGPVATGDVVDVQLTLKDVTVEIAPGIQYAAWGFEGGVPGPAIHVRQGQRIRMTLTNGGAIPHSIDFHSARIAPDKAFVDVMPGESVSYEFVAKDPGVFMYHCGTKPVLAHIANGMYGAIVVDPADPLPKADREYVLVSSEWYLSTPGLDEPAGYSGAKAHSMQPDWVTWNGYAAQYVTHPLTADPGETVRFYVVAAGPSFGTDFHVVGTILDRAWVDGDMTQFSRGVQTVHVPAGGGAVFDVKIDEPGLYPFVSHSFASVDLGQVGLLKVGEVEGTMSH